MKRLAVLLSLVALPLGLSQSLVAADAVDFGKQIYPILKNSCLSCHAAPYVDAASGRTKKPKGGVRFDTVELIAKGYINDDDEAVKSVVPGKPEKSPLYTSAALPADDEDITPGKPDHSAILARVTTTDEDDFMPPKGDPLTKAQLALIKQWITEGAKVGGFVAPAYVNPKAKK